MEPLELLLVAGVVLTFGVISRRVAATAVTAPMVFVAIGLLIGPHALGLLHAEPGEGGFHLLAEITLALVLFGDAARIDLKALRRELGLPVRLLFIGLPLTIGAGSVAAKLLFWELSWAEAAVLGAVLAPTDAALGQAVVSSKKVPLRIRQALNVESGLNDGIAVPVVMLLVALAGAMHGADRSAGEWAVFATLQVTLGPLAGIAVGWAGGALVEWADRRELMEESYERLAGLAIAVLAFAIAELIGGNGFIATFAAGITLGNRFRGRCEWLYQFLEAEGTLLMLLVFLFFGATMVWPSFATADVRVFAYAALSLTVLRMLPVSLSLIGSGVRAPTHVFLGWFGPRGLASLLFAVLIVAEAPTPHAELLFTTTVVAVASSVLFHGLTAQPGAQLYGRLAQDDKACPVEHQPVAEHPLRITAAQ